MRRAPGEATGFAAAGLPEQIELSRASCTEVCTHDVLGRLRMRGGTTDHPSRGDRGFESCSLQRRVICEPDFLDQNTPALLIKISIGPSPSCTADTIACTCFGSYSRSSAILPFPWRTRKLVNPRISMSEHKYHVDQAVEFFPEQVRQSHRFPEPSSRAISIGAQGSAREGS
jgi:hypothetical protein